MTHEWSRGPLEEGHHNPKMLSVLALCALSAPSEDSVTSLPGFGIPPQPQWSGFLPSGENVATGGEATLHYWFAQSSRSDAANAPVVLWLNGGPGSSSILGMLQEHGPLLINSTGGLMENPYAWTQLVNLLILESPAGVGYSYCEASLTGGGCENTDNTTAAAARGALQHFFDVKFPELKENPFFITGESYAGVYVPTLSREILDNAPEINIQGMAVDDPCTDNVAQADSMDMLWYGHKNGMVPEAEFNFLWNNCSMRNPSHISDGAWGALAKGSRASFANPERVTMRDDPSPACVLAKRKFLASTSRGFSQGWPLAWLNDLSLFGPAAVVPFTAPGSLNYMTAQWMLKPETKAALHVTTSPSTHWPGPQDKWGYTSNWAACNGNAPPGTPSMIDFYRNIAPRLSTTIVFNGDTDPWCVRPLSLTLGRALSRPLHHVLTRSPRSRAGPLSFFPSQRLVRRHTRSDSRSRFRPASRRCVPAVVLQRQRSDACIPRGEAPPVRPRPRARRGRRSVRRPCCELFAQPQLRHRARERSHGAAVSPTGRADAAAQPRDGDALRRAARRRRRAQRDDRRSV